MSMRPMALAAHSSFSLRLNSWGGEEGVSSVPMAKRRARAAHAQARPPAASPHRKRLPARPAPPRPHLVADGVCQQRLLRCHDGLVLRQAHLKAAGLSGVYECVCVC